MFIRRVSLLLAVAFAFLATVTNAQSQIAVLSDQANSQHDQLLAAIQQALVDVSSSLSVANLRVSNDSYETIHLIEDYLAANASITSAFIQLDGIYGDDTISAALRSNNIPILRYTPSAFDTTATNYIDPKVYFNAIFDLMAAFQWNTTNVVFDASLQGSVDTFASEASKFGVVVQDKHLTDSENTFEDVMLAIDRSPVKVVVAMLDAVGIGQLIVSLEDVEVQVIWIDLNTRAPSVSSVELSGLLTQLNPFRGFFTLQPLYDSTKATSLFNRLNSTQPGLFPSTNVSALTPLLSAVYDVTLAWATAVNEVITNSGDPMNSTLVIAALESLSNQSIASLISSAHTYQRNSGLNVGPLQLLNFKLTNNNTLSWVCIGTWTGPLTINGTSTLVLNSSLVQFSNGGPVAPPAVMNNVLRMGFLSYFAISMGKYWAEVCRLAQDRINNDTSILPGYRLKINFQDDNYSQYGVIQGSMRLLQRGASIILGPTTSAMAQALQFYIGGLGIPNIAFSATAEALSDKSLYPTFTRTIDSDSAHGLLFAAFVGRYNWTKTCTITATANPSAFTNYDQTTLINQGEAHFTVHTIVVSPTQTNFSAALEDLRNSGCTVVISTASSNPADRLFPQAIEAGLMGVPNMTWVWTNGLFHFVTLTNYTGYTGVFYTQPLDSPDPATFQQFISDVADRTPLPFGAFSTYLYDAIYLGARALDRMIRNGQSLQNSTLLLSAMKEVSFNGLSGRVSLDSKGNRVGGMFGLYNLQPTGVNGTLRNILVGEFTGGVLRMVADPIFSDGTTNPPKDPEIPKLTLPYASGGAALVALASVGLLALVATLVTVFVFYHNKLIRRSSPFYLQVIVVGLSMALVSVFFWIGEPTPAYCHLRVWLGFVGISTAYSALLAKNARLYWLFSEPSLRIQTITNRQLLIYLLVCLSPLLVVLVLWSSLTPFVVDYRETPSGTEHYLVCTTPNDVIYAAICFAYMGVLFIVGAVISYRTRTLPDVFRESWFIALATYNMLVLSALCIVLGYVLEDLIAVAIIICGGLILCTYTTHALVFLPKFYALASKKAEIANMSSSRSKTTTKNSLDLSSYSPEDR